MTFGPVSVLPKYQKQGYGEKLINYTIDKAKLFGYDAIIITGNPDYYQKYGFVSASKYEIYYEGMEKEETPFFMIKILDENKVKELKGIYSDPKCYNIDELKLLEFDKLFPKKQKAKTENQL